MTAQIIPFPSTLVPWIESAQLKELVDYRLTICINESRAQAEMAIRRVLAEYPRYADPVCRDDYRA